MEFAGITFLYYFLPCFLILYYVVPKSWKNPVLLLGSLIFCAWGGPRCLWIMLLEIAGVYACGLCIERFRGKIGAKIFLGISITISIGMLGYFQYADFFIENFKRITNLPVSLLHVALPMGISIYTFQMLGYTIDVYRGTVAAQKNPVTLAVYAALFPLLSAGPIVRYADVQGQLKSRPQNFACAAQGTKRFLIGLGKQALLANELGKLCAAFTASNDKSLLFYWLQAIAFMLWLYYEFSGYSDMAIGLGKLLGFDFKENFRYPYAAGSIRDFWSRWNISLGSWVREYVYLPLAGSRASGIRWGLAVFAACVLAGFWYGAEWKFLIWGLLSAVLLLLEKLFLGKYLEKARIWNHIYVLFLVLLGFVLFGTADMAEAGSYVAAMFGMGKLPVVSQEFFYYLRSYAVVLEAGAIGATPLLSSAIARVRKNPAADKIFNVLEILLLAGCLIVVTGYLMEG